MTQWAQSLIRISGYEVETLQKRLAEIATRRATAEMRLAVLDAERELETDHARADFTVFDVDLMTAPVEEIPNGRALLTIVDGQESYRAEGW